MQGGSGGALYRYRGPDGRIVVVDTLSEVPEAQRPSAERVVAIDRPGTAPPASGPWRFDWPSAGVGFGAAALLAVVLFASRRGSRLVFGVVLVLGLCVLGMGAYFGFLRQSTGQGGSTFASPSAVIDDAKRAVDHVDRRNREQERQIEEIQREAK
jgi:hypothetical protein